MILSMPPIVSTSKLQAMDLRHLKRKFKKAKAHGLCPVLEQLTPTCLTVVSASLGVTCMEAFYRYCVLGEPSRILRVAHKVIVAPPCWKKSAAL